MTLSLILSKPLLLLWLLRLLTIKIPRKVLNEKKQNMLKWARGQPILDSRGTLTPHLPKIRTKVL